MLIPIGLEDARISRVPRATIAIVGVCVFIQTFAWLLGVDRPYGLALIPTDGLRQVGWYTAPFTHFGWWHLFGNMLVFVFVCGPFMEDAWGTRYFAWFYLLAGLIPLAAEAAFQQARPVAIAGASGAVCACLGAFAVRFSGRKVRLFWSWSILVKPTFLVPAWAWVLFGFALNLRAAMTGSSPGIAVVAHVTGYLFGAAAALAIRHWRLEERLLRSEGGWSTSEPVWQAARALRRGKPGDARALLEGALASQPIDPTANLELARLEIAAGRLDVAAARVARLARNAVVSRPALCEVVAAIGPKRFRPPVALLLAEDLEEYDRGLALALADRGSEAGGRLGVRALAFGGRLAMRGRQPEAARVRVAKARSSPDLPADLGPELEALEREAAGQLEVAWRVDGAACPEG